MSKDQFVIPPLDIMNQLINTGDCVVFGLGGTMTLASGIVKKINKKTVTIQHIFSYTNHKRKLVEREDIYYRTYDNVVVVK